MVAVSGGVDSMVLCDLLHEADYNFAIAHCNFQLRERDAPLDEAFVLAKAEELGVVCHVERFDTREYAKTNQLSTQMAARELRYRWFEELKRIHEYHILLTAHHRNDLAETMLLNFTKGTSINGLLGIPIVNDWVVRPLLSFNKSELLRYAINKGIKWREDVSNKSIDYLRNKLRQEVVPILEDINPSFLKQMERLAEKNSAVQEVWKKHVEALRSDLFSTSKDWIEIDIKGLKEKQVSPFSLQELLIPYGFNYEQCETILATLDHVGAQFQTERFVLTVDRASLLIRSVDHQEDEVLQLNDQDKDLLLEQMYGISYKDNLKLEIDRDPANAMLDMDKLTYPLTIRRWQVGDAFRPLGMRGKKLISDFLIDTKVPLVRKNEVKVLMSGDEIAWLIGFRISDTFKVTDQTKRIIHFQRTNAD